MSISFNEGGLVTRGLGQNNRLTTRGFGQRLDFGGVLFKRKSKEYYLDLSVPVSKEGETDLGVYSPIQIKKEEAMNIFSSVFKETETNLDVLARLDSSKLSEILDAVD